MNQDKLTHFDEDGNPSMVDINSKNMTKRVAIASGKIKMQSETLKKILNIACCNSSLTFMWGLVSRPEGEFQNATSSKRDSCPK